MERRDWLVVALIFALLFASGSLVVAGIEMLTTTISFTGEVPENDSMTISIDGHVYDAGGSYSLAFTSDGLLDPGNNYIKVLRLTNDGNSVRAFNVLIDANPSGNNWLSSDMDSGSVAAFSYVDVTLTLAVPDEAEAGSYSFPVTISF